MVMPLVILLGIALFVVVATVSAPVLRLWVQDPVGAAVPLLACVIVLAAPQMADMMAGMKGGYGITGIRGDSWWHELGFGLGVFMLGLQGWFWTRAASNARGGYRDAADPDMAWPVRWAPRLTLLPTTLVAISPLIMASSWPPYPKTWIGERLAFVTWQQRIPWSSVPWTGVLSAVAACLFVGACAWYRRPARRAVRQLAARHAVQLAVQMAEQLAAQKLVGPPQVPAWPGVTRLFAAAPAGSAARRALLVHGLLRVATPAAAPALPDWRVTRLFAAAPLGGAGMAWVLLVVALCGIAIAQWAPDFINDNLPTPTAAFLAMSCVVPVACIMLALCRDVIEGALCWLRDWLTASDVALDGVADRLGLLLLIAIPIGGSYAAQGFGMYDVHPPPDSTSLVVNGRPGIEQAVSTYLTTCHPNETGAVPAIIVASEGGASRSAVWTLSVMRMLDARTAGAFGAHLFAITSVSGGSLAAVTYDLAQAAYLPAGSTAPTPDQQMKFWDRAMPGLVELGHGDLLSSAIARMFTSDLLLGVPRRGPALARAFENNWGRPGGFALGDTHRGLLAARDGRDCLPHLLLNGTDVATGDRLLTSTVTFDDRSGLFPAAIDVLGGQQADVLAADAVLNSARFPMISPPGRLPKNSSFPPLQPHDLMVIDGGVFENYGARTAWELVEALRADKQAQRLEPIVVLISNDSDESPATCATPTPATADELNARALQAGQTAGGIAVPEILTSLLGLYNSRGGHGRGEIGMLRKQLCAPPPGHLFHFDLPEPIVSQDQSAPMNWVLDANACTFMLGAARTELANPQQPNAVFVNPEQAAALTNLLLRRGGAAADATDPSAGDAARCNPPGGPSPGGAVSKVTARQ